MRRDDELTTTADGERFDPETGEVLPLVKKGPWGRPKRTPEEQAAAAQVLAERKAQREEELAVLRIVDPDCAVDGDPPVWRQRPTRIGGEPRDVLLDLPRLSGRALPGSRLVVAARSYDGAGPNGGEARDYASMFARFCDRLGYPRRTVGVAIRREELRDVARVLTDYADALDSEDARGST